MLKRAHLFIEVMCTTQEMEIDMTTTTPTEKTELQSHAEHAPSGPFDAIFDLAMKFTAPASVMMAGSSAARFFNGTMSAQTFGVVLGGSAFLVAAVSAVKYLAKHYPDGLLAKPEELGIPSKDEIATGKAELGAEKKDILAELADIEAALDAKKPSMKL